MKLIKSPIYISWTKFNWHAHYQAITFNARIYFLNTPFNSSTDFKKLFKLIDYLFKSFKTILIIIKSHSNIIFIENPPPIGGIIGFFLSRILKYKLVIDAHNGAFESPMINIPFTKYSLSKATAVIVHNNSLRFFLGGKKEFKNCSFFTLNDPLPQIPVYSSEDIGNYILIVTTFHGDEPIEIVLEGVKYFIEQNPGTDIQFRVTGNYNKKINLYEKYNQPRILFLGFVSQEEYFKQLVNSLCVMSYSVREMVQQYALMEALGAGKPFISNKNLTNTELFGDKMIFTDNDPLSIAEGIEKFLQNREQLINNIEILKRELSLKRKDDLEKIKKHLGL